MDRRRPTTALIGRDCSGQSKGALPGLVVFIILIIGVIIWGNNKVNQEFESIEKQQLSEFTPQVTRVKTPEKVQIQTKLVKQDEHDEELLQSHMHGSDTRMHTDRELVEGVVHEMPLDSQILMQ
ncbi:MAG: hypothetical protein K8S27_13200 [Candidatus Omnitrophica bacterium]|nr:hypothetical protein [Candidatus Omnitrophota bacterium]